MPPSFRPQLLWAAFAFLVLSPLVVRAQTFVSITDGSVSTCQLGLFDSAGPGDGTADYQNNEDHVLTICPDDPDMSISILFFQFSLSTAVDGTGWIDNLAVYDGSDINAPLIGEYNGYTPPGLVMASFANTSGCLTLRFRSNTTGTGQFAGSISCTVPCQPPTAVATMNAGDTLARVCIGDTLFFNGSASYAAPGQELASWIWDFDNDGIDSTSGPLVSHVFTAPGDYHLNLAVTDTNGCLSTTREHFIVLVSTIPTMEGFADRRVCLGESLTIQPTVVLSTTWTGVPSQSFGDGLSLPDDIGLPFTTSITFDAYPPGALLSSLDDLVSLCVDMEHSFLGDFVLTITSPTGVTVPLHQQGGNGTFLGIPVDGDESNPTPGTCWNYCFTPSNNAGTWVANAGGTIPAGNYAPVGNFANLIGSPLNGTWTLTYTDMWAADNGFMCGWNLNFNPALLGDVIEFTPVLGTNHVDSTGWIGPNLTPSPTAPMSATIIPTEPGTFTYTFTVTDNFGCRTDTSLTLVVDPDVRFTLAIDSTTLCDDAVRLVTHMAPPLNPGPITYQWTPWQGLSGTTVPGPLANPSVPTWYRLLAQPYGHPLCGMRDSILVYPLTTMDHVHTLVEPLCHGDDNGSITISTTGNAGPWTYTWLAQNMDTLLTTVPQDQSNWTGTAGSYQVLITETGGAWPCTDTLSVLLPEPDLLTIASFSGDTTICHTGTATLQAVTTGGVEPYTHHWSIPAAYGSTWQVSPDSSTFYQLVVEDANQCITDTSGTMVTVLPGITFSLVDTVLMCPNVDYPVGISALAGGNGNYSIQWSNGSPSVPNLLLTGTTSQDLCVTVSDGCETPPLTECVRLHVHELPDVVLLADTVEGCPGLQVNFALEDTSGAAYVRWDLGYGFAPTPGPSTASTTYHQHGDYTVSALVRWPNGCFDSTRVVHMIHVEPLPTPEMSWSPNPPNVEWPYVELQAHSGPFATTNSWVFHTGDTLHGDRGEWTYPDHVGGSYPVQLIAANYLGCSASITRLLEVEDALRVFVPTAFTPDGDGLNELLTVQGRDIATTGFHWRIFDRWGRVVYESTDLREGWNGQVRSATPVTGVYPWIMTVFSKYSGIEYELRGQVTIIQ